MEAKISVEGLAALNRALRQVDAAAPKQMRLALNAAADLLVTKVQPLIPTRTGAARRSLKARSTRTSARISVGGRKAPYYPWLDFGGRTGPRRSVERPFYKEGRYVYPTLKRERPAIERILQQRLQAVVTDAGLDVS